MLRTEYKFTNEYGLSILDDSPMDTKKADAYFRFLENSIKNDGILQEKKSDDETQQEILMMA